MEQLRRVVSLCLGWTNSRQRSLGVLLILFICSGGSLIAQPSCVAACKDRDSVCSGLVGRAYAQCLAQCENKCHPAPTPTPLPPLLSPGCGNRAITGKIMCTIDQPNVTQRETVYPTVQFAPGDMVRIDADGCVQTGGSGDTWKRYVNPTGGGTNDKYHGLIRIPTAQPDAGGLIRIEKANQRLQTVTGTGLPVSQLVLHLGYEDDDYSDNGYYGHDDGNDDQCKIQGSNDGGPAHVTITIFRGVKPDGTTSRFDFDVESDALPDPNGMLYNPLWSWQQRNPGQIPSTSMCHEFSERGSILDIPQPVMVPNFPDCTDQSDNNSVDGPIGTNANICYWGKGGPLNTGSFVGHVNWFPVTLEGHAGPIDHNADDDYSFTFNSDASGNPLSVNGRGGLHLEFDSDETIDHFRSGEWQKFHDAVDARDDAKGLLADCEAHITSCTAAQITQYQATIAAAGDLFAGHTIVTGMFGMDGEHDLKAELHPLFAMATRRDKPALDPKDDVWLIFVRNRGDEGFCSSQLWDSGFEDYTFRLPWLAGMNSVDVNWNKTDFEGTEGTSGPTISIIQPPMRDPAVYVTFHLGPAAGTPFIDGALHLTWVSRSVLTTGSRTGVSGGAASTARRATIGTLSLPATITGQPQAEGDEVENKLQAAVHQLPPTQRQQVLKARANVGVQPVVVHRLPPGGPARILATPPALARIAPQRRAIKAGPATRKTSRDAAQIQALCLVTHGAPAGLPPEVCKSTVRDHR